MPGLETTTIEDLIRFLVQRSARSNGHGGGAEQPIEGEEIILDAEVDGARYLFVRLSKPAPAPAQLSPREQEIVRLVAQGHSNKIIGDVLNISSWTVCTHLRRIFAKLGVGSRAAMVARLLDLGRRRNSARAGGKSAAASANGSGETLPSMSGDQPAPSLAESCEAPGPRTGSKPYGS